MLPVLALEIFRNKNYMRIGNVPIIYSEVSIVQIINQRTFYQGCFLNLNGSLSDRVKLESISNNNLPFRFLKRWVTFTGNSPIEDFLCPNDHRAPSLYFVAFSTYVLRLNLHFLFVGCTQCCKSQSFY